MQAPKTKWKHTNHYLNSKDTNTVTKTPSVSYFTLICIQPGLCGNQTTQNMTKYNFLFHSKSACWLTSFMQTAVNGHDNVFLCFYSIHTGKHNKTLFDWGTFYWGWTMKKMLYTVIPFCLDDKHHHPVGALLWRVICMDSLNGLTN